MLVEEENFQDYKRRKKEEKLRNSRKKPYMESFLGKLQMWLERAWVRKMAQKRFFKEGNRGLDPRCSITSFETKFGQAQHR